MNQLDVRNPQGRGGIAALLGGVAGRPWSITDDKSGEVIQGVTVAYMGGNQAVMIPDNDEFELVKEGDWITATGSIIDKKGTLKMGDRFTLDTINGKPVGELLDAKRGTLPDTKSNPKGGTKAA